MEQSEKRAYVIGIAGGSASGKSSIVSQLKDSFPADQLCFISQDNYYLDMELQMTDAQGEINFDLPSAIEEKTLVEDVKRLIEGKMVTRKEYTFNNSDGKPNIIYVKPAPIIIVEGLFVFHFIELAKLFDLRIYVEAKDDIKLKRRIKRDAEERGYDEADVRYRWKNHVTPCYEKYLRPYREQSHVVLINNHSYYKGLDILTDHIRKHLV
jgi:uridine kinase